MRFVGRLVGWVVVLLIPFVVGGLAGSALTSAFGGSERAAAVGAWVGGLGAALISWCLLRAARRRRRAARTASDRAAGEQLRSTDLARYRELLAGASETLAVVDPDLYVGQKLGLPSTAEKPLFGLRRGSNWKPSTGAQRTAVDELTKELERATLVRSLDDGSTEVVGVKDCVGFRYVVDASGGVTLVTTDDSQARWGRRMSRIGCIGILMFIGSFVVTFVLDRSGAVPGWLVPFMIVGFVFAFVGIASNVDPRNFIERGERWDEHGSGWDSGD